MKVPGLDREIEEKVDVLNHKEGTKGHVPPACPPQRPESHQGTIDHAEGIEVRKDVLLQYRPLRHTVKGDIRSRVTHVQRLFELPVFTLDVRAYLAHDFHSPHLFSHVPLKNSSSVLDNVSQITSDLLGEHTLTA